MTEVFQCPANKGFRFTGTAEGGSFILEIAELFILIGTITLIISRIVFEIIKAQLIIADDIYHKDILKLASHINLWTAVSATILILGFMMLVYRKIRK